MSLAAIDFGKVEEHYFAHMAKVVSELPKPTYAKNDLSLAACTSANMAALQQKLSASLGVPKALLWGDNPSVSALPAYLQMLEIEKANAKYLQAVGSMFKKNLFGFGVKAPVLPKEGKLLRFVKLGKKPRDVA